MKPDIRRERQQQIIVKGTAYPSGKALKSLHEHGTGYSVLSSSVQYTVIMFYNSTQKK
jgi:hypothetical protein